MFYINRQLSQYDENNVRKRVLNVLAQEIRNNDAYIFFLSPRYPILLLLFVFHTRQR